MIKNQNFGVEIELTGITRQQAASIIANYFGTTSRYIGTYYKTWGATDRKSRTWKAMSDASIRTQRKVNGRTVNASHDYSCELVTPILQYEDLEDLQNIVRALREAGAIANSSCGIHVHVDGKGTVEFRLFNGTTHAGKIKAYVQFCLAMSAWAIESDADHFFKEISHYSKEQKGELMKRVLKNRLGLKGAEFKTCRQHLTSAFTSAAA